MSRISLSFAALSLSCLGFALAGWAFGQGGEKQLGNSLQITEDHRKIAQSSSDLTSAMSMKTKPNPADPKSVEAYKAMLEKAAKFYAYRVTWVPVLYAKTPEKGDPEIVKHVTEFNRHIKSVLDLKASANDDPTFVNAYSPLLASSFAEVTDLPPIENAKAIVHLTMMMPALAKLKHDSVSKYLVGLLDSKSNKHDYIKLGAIRAIREFMPVEAWGDPVTGPDLQNKPRLAHKAGDLERVEALTNFILRPAPPASASPEEVEAYRYLRREAIETLGLAGAPAVSAFNVGGKTWLEAPIAPLFVRICMGANGGEGALAPEPNLAERNEAALGLCNMVVRGDPLPRAVKAFDPTPTYYFIGKTLRDLGQEFSNDFAIIAGGQKLPPALPWKSIGKRWEMGLDRLVANAPPGDKAADKAAAAIAAGLASQGKPMVKIFQEVNPKANVNINNYPNLGKGPPPAEFLLFKPPVVSAPIKWEPKE